MDDASVFTLVKHRGHPAQNPLLGFLQNVQDRSVEIQCDDIGRMDAINLQILLSAQRKWAAANLEFRLTRMNRITQDSLKVLGSDFSHFADGDEN